MSIIPLIVSVQLLCSLYETSLYFYLFTLPLFSFLSQLLQIYPPSQFFFICSAPFSSYFIPLISALLPCIYIQPGCFLAWQIVRSNIYDFPWLCLFFLVVSGALSLAQSRWDMARVSGLLKLTARIKFCRCEQCLTQLGQFE